MKVSEANKRLVIGRIESPDVSEAVKRVERAMVKMDSLTSIAEAVRGIDTRTGTATMVEAMQALHQQMAVMQNEIKRVTDELQRLVTQLEKPRTWTMEIDRNTNTRLLQGITIKESR